MCEYHCHRSQKSINYSIYVYMCIYLQEMLGNDWNNVGDDHFYLFPCPFQSIIASTSIIYHVHNTYVLITFGPLNVKSFIVEKFQHCCSSIRTATTLFSAMHFQNKSFISRSWPAFRWKIFDEIFCEIWPFSYMYHHEFLYTIFFSSMGEISAKMLLQRTTL